MISSVIGRLQTGTYAVTRKVAGTYDNNGRAVTGSSTVITVDAVVQPYNPRKLAPLPEGIRSEEARLLHATTLLRTQDNTGPADIVTISGEQYTVLSVSGPWQLRGSTHYECIVARQGRP